MTEPTSRDETAFSVDPSTGMPTGSLADVNRGHEAMQALDRGDVDEAGYHEMLADEPTVPEPPEAESVDAAPAAEAVHSEEPPPADAPSE